MARAAALLLIGVLLFVAIVFIVSRAADMVKVHSNTVRNIVILVVIAAVAFWYFGNGMVYEYFNK
jgi:hypothetical protein